MRKTGSREPRASFEASFMSPVSIAVKTFSTRFGSRRNQRKPHQTQRSITTNNETMDTTRIGHMIGPPALKFRMKKFELGASAGAGAGLVSAATVAVTAGVATAAGEPAAAVAAGLPASGATAGATVVPGAATDAPGAAASGAVERAGEVSDAAGGLSAG